MSRRGPWGSTQRKLPQPKRGLPTLNPSVHDDQDLFTLDTEQVLAGYQVKLSSSPARIKQREGNKTITRPQSASVASKTALYRQPLSRRPQSAMTPTWKNMRGRGQNSATAPNRKVIQAQRTGFVSQHRMTKKSKQNVASPIGKAVPLQRPFSAMAQSRMPKQIQRPFSAMTQSRKPMQIQRPQSAMASTYAHRRGNENTG